MNLTNQISADEKLLTWARGSIRYNGRRIDQARDFISKLHYHGVRIEGATINAVAKSLSAIEKSDNEGK